MVSWEVQSRGFLAVTNHGHDRAVGGFEQIGLVACWDDRRGQSKSVSPFSSRTCETARNVVEVVGAYTAVVYMLGLPIAVHLKAVRSNHGRNLTTVALHGLLFVVGSVLALTQFFLKGSDDDR